MCQYAIGKDIQSGQNAQTLGATLVLAFPLVMNFKNLSLSPIPFRNLLKMTVCGKQRSKLEGDVFYRVLTFIFKHDTHQTNVVEFRSL